jgi:EAL domain-containing protein (putative c-di-GMP-specific phosphodiesterase class I)
LTEDKASDAIVRAIIAVAHAVGMSAIAEGVETVQQLDFLSEAGCDSGQGAFLGETLLPENLAGALAV